MAGIIPIRQESGLSWERIPGETPGEYRKFCAYRDMRPADKTAKQRSLQKLAEELGITLQHLKKVSGKNKWVSRCEEYDAYVDEKARQQCEAEIIEMRKNHALLASQMLKKAAKRLLTISEDEISVADIVRMVDVGVKIERLSRGEPTENQRVSGETRATHGGEIRVKSTGDLNLSSLSDEELADLEGLLEKLHTEASA